MKEDDMVDLEKRARDMLAEETRRAHEAPFGAPTQLWDIAIRAIVAALRQQPAAVVDEAARLLAICQNAHDRLLRGDDDSELLAILEQAWSAHEAVESP